MNYTITVLQSDVRKVEQYVIEHPGCTQRDIMEALCLNQSTISTNLGRLRCAGKVRRLPKVKGERRVRWMAGEDVDFVRCEKPIVQHTVTTWEPCNLRDPLIDAFFGRHP